MYTYKVDFAALKSELQMLEKNDFSLTNTNNERLVSEIEKLRQRLREEVARTQAGVRLDLNLEKGRIRDEAATQELKVRATEERIEQEIAGLRTQMETIKLQTLQYMIGTITGAGALILGKGCSFYLTRKGKLVPSDSTDRCLFSSLYCPFTAYLRMFK